MIRQHAMPFGARVDADGVTFRLWAPGASRVELGLDDDRGSTRWHGLSRAEAGWYAVVQVPTLQSEEDLVVDLLSNDGVLTHPGFFFDFRRQSYLILSLLPPEPIFADGVRRVLARVAQTA